MRRCSASLGSSRAVQLGQARANRAAPRHLSSRSLSIASCCRSLEPGRPGRVRPRAARRRSLRCARNGCTSRKRQHEPRESRRAASHDAAHPRLRYIGVCVDPLSGFRVILKKAKIEQKKNIVQVPLHRPQVESGGYSARAAIAGNFSQFLIEDRESVLDG